MQSRRTHSSRAANQQRPVLALWAALSAAIPLTAQAQVPTDAAAVVVTGTRLPSSASGLAQNVTIIDRQQIQAANPARVEDLLAQVTGAYVDQAGKTGSFVSMYMRGAENSHLLIMLDGVKLNDPTTTRGSAYDLSSIDVALIERIEVLRGPASAVYGGEALAGVVHIITRRPSQGGLSGRVYGALGGDHHRKLGGSVAFGQPALQAQVSAGRSEDGSSGSDARLRLNTAAAALRFSPDPRMQGELFFNRVERSSWAFPDDSGGPRLAVVREQTRRDSTDDSYGLKLADGDPRGLLLQASVTVLDRQERADNVAVDPGVRFPVPAFVSNTDFKRTNSVLTATHDNASGFSVVIGLERQTERGSLTSVGDFFFIGSPQTLTFELDRSTHSAFAEARARLAPGLSAQLGVRRDKVEGIAAVTTPHLGLVWSLAEGNTVLKANVNEGFKPPSFFALGFPIGGNPGLRPERSKNVEITLVQRLGGIGTGQVTLFQTSYKDLVDFDGDTFSNINRGRIVVKGVEPSLNLQVARSWRAQVSATLLEIDVRDGLQPLRNRPERRASASLLHELDARSTLFASLNHTGSFLDRSNPTGDLRMPGFTTVDVGASYKLDPVQIRLSVDNLLNKSYEQFVGFAAPGRRVRVGLQAGF